MVVEINLDNLDDLDEELGQESAPSSPPPEPAGEFDKKTIAPCVIVKGLTTEDEVLAFIKRVGVGEDLLPLYMEFEGQLVQIGRFNVSFDNILFLHYMKQEGILVTPDGKEVSLNDSNMVYNFLRV